MGLVLFLIGGCDGVGTDPAGDTGFDTELETERLAKSSVTTDEIDSGQYGNIVEGTREVLRSDDELTSFWADLHADQTDAGNGEIPDPPQVDFETQVVVAVVLGERPNGGYDVGIDRVMFDDEEGEMQVEYTETEPGDGCAVSSVLTSPYVLVAVDTQGEPADPNDEVTFASSEETRSCS